MCVCVYIYIPFHSLNYRADNPHIFSLHTFAHLVASLLLSLEALVVACDGGSSVLLHVLGVTQHVAWLRL